MQQIISWFSDDSHATSSSLSWSLFLPFKTLSHYSAVEVTPGPAIHNAWYSCWVAQLLNINQQDVPNSYPSIINVRIHLEDYHPEQLKRCRPRKHYKRVIQDPLDRHPSQRSMLESTRSITWRIKGSFYSCLKAEVIRRTCNAQVLLWSW